MTAHDWVNGWCRGCGQHDTTMNLTGECSLGLEEARQAALQPNAENRPPVTPAQPRHPLALLADGWEARARLLTENARAEQNEQSARYYAARAAEAQDCAAQLREALRAQAEAGPDVEAARAHRWLTLRNDLTSVFEKLGCFDESGEWRDTDEADQWRTLAHKIYESADRLGRMNRRAALAQAGGES